MTPPIQVLRVRHRDLKASLALPVPPGGWRLDFVDDDDPTATWPPVGLVLPASPAPHVAPPSAGFPDEELTEMMDVSTEGQAHAAIGVSYLVEGLIPNYGMVGLLTAYTKVGKTTFSLALGAAVATGTPFLGRAVQPVRVLVLAAEDPPEWTAYLTRHLTVPKGRMSVRRLPLRLDAPTLARIVATIAAGGYGLVLIASWQAVTAGLVKDENDNAGAVVLMEAVKQAARTSGVPWLFDAHSGKGEDQRDDADPTRALRGASAAAGAADYLLWLRYLNGSFGTQRRLSGKGRFVNFADVLLDMDPTTGQYRVVDDAQAGLVASTWALIEETGALTGTPRSLHEIAKACFGVAKPTGTHRRQVQAALRGRPLVLRVDDCVHGKTLVRYRWASEDTEAV